MKAKMTIRKKANPYIGNGANEMSFSNLNPGNPGKIGDGFPVTRESYATGSFPGRSQSLALDLQYKVSDRTYLDPAEVQQWVTNSSAGSDVYPDGLFYEHGTTRNESQPSTSKWESDNQGSLCRSQSAGSHLSFQHCFPEPQLQGLSVDFENDGNSMVASRVPSTCELSHSLDVDSSMSFMGEQYPSNWPCPTPISDDLMLGNSAALHPNLALDHVGLSLGWPAVPFQADGEVSNEFVLDSSQTATWTSIPAIGSSVSSSYSHNDLSGFSSYTPVSPDVQEETWFSGHRGSLDDNTGQHQCFSSGSVTQCPSGSEHPGSQLDTSTLKASHVFQCTSIASVGPWAQPDVSKPVYSSPPLPTRKRSSEGETTTARGHPFYNAALGDDGFYHCPFEGKDDCNHKPEKLKCNYDKHLDSHLKPYRCKVSSCVAVPFSSTACLLRHEREAHGMHGHGEKPNLCTFPDCDRSLPGNGFPRRWNLGDHMKRVHDYTAPARSNASSSPSPSVNSYYQGVSSKRRTSNTSHSEGPKRAKQGSSSKPSPKIGKANTVSSSQGKRRQSIDKMWYERKAALTAGLESFDPNDVHASSQINADYTILQNIASSIRQQQASQLTI